MKPPALIAGILLLGGSSLSGAPPLELHVSPTFSSAPTTLRIRATVEPRHDRRALAVVIESEDFFRSSEVPLDGEDAPRHLLLEYRNLPAGTYDVQAAVLDADGKPMAAAHRCVAVVGFDADGATPSCGSNVATETGDWGAPLSDPPLAPHTRPAWPQVTRASVAAVCTATHNARPRTPRSRQVGSRIAATARSGDKLESDRVSRPV
jgi:hypothetical protein